MPVLSGLTGCCGFGVCVSHCEDQPACTRVDCAWDVLFGVHSSCFVYALPVLAFWPFAAIVAAVVAERVTIVRTRYMM